MHGYREIILYFHVFKVIDLVIDRYSAIIYAPRASWHLLRLGGAGKCALDDDCNTWTTKMCSILIPKLEKDNQWPYMGSVEFVRELRFSSPLNWSVLSGF